MEYKVVIGASYGDEGKGQLTNYFTRKAKGKVLNVLHNGGCQRGHTVVHAGKRHVFHCFGSGSNSGAHPYWHKAFLVDPIAIMTEMDGLGYCPKIYVHREARIVTPYDCLFNQQTEKDRKDKKHGSCGMGIFATITRDALLPLRIKHLEDEFWVYEQVMRIRQYYQEKACEDFLISIDQFFNCIHLLKQCIEIVDDMPTGYDTVIYEAGQGLRLDQDNRIDFPHLTPSATGSSAIAEEILSRATENDTVEVCYVTRPYLTRHGAGPFENECEPEKINKYLCDVTNFANMWQGSLRFARIDLPKFKEYILKDMYFWHERPSVNFSLALTISNLNNGHLYTGTGDVLFSDVFASLKHYEIPDEDDVTWDTLEEPAAD